MRTYLRVLSGTLVGVSAVLAVGAAGTAGYYHSAAAGRFFEWTVWVVTAPVLGLLALIGMLLFHLAGAVYPLPPGSRPTVRPVRGVLRVMALVQMGIGGLVVVAAVVHAGDRLLIRPSADVGSALVALVVVGVAFGVSCLGGLLWCAVRVAYPDEPPKSPAPLPPAG